MKRTVAVIICAVMVLCAASVYGESSGMGEILKDASVKYLKLYSELANMSKELVRKQRDSIFEYVLLYYTSEMMCQTERNEIFQDDKITGELIDGYAMIMDALCSKRAKYSKGEMTDEEFLDYVIMHMNMIAAAN